MLLARPSAMFPGWAGRAPHASGSMAMTSTAAMTAMGFDEVSAGVGRLLPPLFVHVPLPGPNRRRRLVRRRTVRTSCSGCPVSIRWTAHCPWTASCSAVWAPARRPP